MQSYNDQSRPPPLTYGCICSGLSAPTLAARHLGWKTKFFSEIEKFPRAILAHHYPHIPLHGDFTTIQKDTYGTVDALIGGTPCQDFSVAGKRLGLDAPRGNLALEYISLARRVDAEWLVFENVPGLLSSGTPKGEDFATFISAVTGYEYRPPATGWKNAGIAEGRTDRWGIAWRILDAQYFGVAQRRRRVFVVGHRGDWRPAAAVLLEPESMRGDTPPSRQKASPVAALTANGVGTCGADDNQAQAGHFVPHGFGGGNCSGPIDVPATLTAKGVRQDFEVETFIAQTRQVAPSLTRNPYGDHEPREGLLVAHTLRGEGFDASEDGTGRGTPLIPIPFDTTQITSGTNRSNPQPGDLCHTLSCSGHAPAIAFSCKDDGRDCTDNLSPTLRSMNHNASQANGGGQVAIAYPILEPGARTGASTTDARAGLGIGDDGDPMFTLQAGKTHGIAVSLRGREGGGTAELSGDVMPAVRASQGGGDKPHLLTPSAVRRLTPTECERLQGIPDDFTFIPVKKVRRERLTSPKTNASYQSRYEVIKGEVWQMAADGPRYKAVGNSMAVPVVAWIFNRLDAVRNQLYILERAA